MLSYHNMQALLAYQRRASGHEMYARGIIGKGVNEEPTYSAIISEFEAGLGCYKTVAVVEEHCKKFQKQLEEELPLKQMNLKKNG